MFKKFSKLVAVVLVFALVLQTGITHAESLWQKIDVLKGINIHIDEAKADLRDANGDAVEIFISNGTTYAPVRAISEAASYDVDWDAKSKTVLLSHKGDSASNDIAYLKHYFSIELSEKPSVEELKVALEKLGIKDAELEESTIAELSKSLVEYAALNELALTYNEEEAKKVCLPRKTSSKNIKYLACAIDLGLIPSYMDINSPLSKNNAAIILMNAIEASGNGRNYIGLSSDKDIVAKIKSAGKTFTVFTNKKLTDLGDAVVKSEATTGYNLKYNGYNARFLPKNTIKYGHDNIVHASQLIGLLNKNNLEAKVQIEPKISVYQYLLEWSDGKVPPATPTYQVRKIADDFYLTFAVEYDMLLEFDSTADRDKFNALVNKNAKKSSDNPDKIGLIAGSWWQPLYTTTVKMDEAQYKQINDVVVKDGDFSIHPFATNEKLDSVVNKIKEIDPEAKIETQKIWCNNAFYRYITGSGDE